VNTWTRRALDTTVTPTLAFAPMTGLAVAGVLYTTKSAPHADATRRTHAAAAALRHAEPESAADNVTVHNDRRLVVAFVVGRSGTIAGSWSGHSELPAGADVQAPEELAVVAS